ncbi:MAG: hypothetical protein NXI13_01635 [Proteobacteria bacterium]|nr:hypothetical protein [Pseudomonadota bacterium]
MSSKREAERDFLYLKYFVTMFFILVGGGMMMWSFADGIPYALFMIDSETTSGTVDRIEKDRHGHFYLSYNYVDQNGDRHDKTRLVYRHLSFKAEVGKNIDVTFSPRFPKIAEATPMVPSLRFGFWTMIVGAVLIVVLGAYSIVSILQLIKHRKDDRYY